MRRAVLLLASVIALAAAAPASAANGLVASWPFDEGSGTLVRDSSGHGNNGTISGDAQWVGGFSGSALSFDGNTGRVRVPDSASLDPATAVSVVAWIKATKPQGDYNYILAKGASGCLAASYGLYTGPNGGVMFYIARNGGLSYTRSPDGGDGVWNGTWHFVVGTYDGSSVRLYTDGTQIGNGRSSNGPIDYDFPENDLFIGHYDKCAALDFHGQVDSPQIYNRALTASEIRAMYDQSTGVSGSGSSSNGPGNPQSPSSPDGDTPSAARRLAAIVGSWYERPVGCSQRLCLRTLQRKATTDRPSGGPHGHQRDQLGHNHFAGGAAFRAERCAGAQGCIARSPTQVRAVLAPP